MYIGCTMYFILTIVKGKRWNLCISLSLSGDSEFRWVWLHNQRTHHRPAGPRTSTDAAPKVLRALPAAPALWLILFPESKSNEIAFTNKISHQLCKNFLHNSFSINLLVSDWMMAQFALAVHLRVEFFGDRIGRRHPRWLGSSFGGRPHHSTSIRVLCFTRKQQLFLRIN